jgi:hypothetical protein
MTKHKRLLVITMLLLVPCVFSVATDAGDRREPDAINRVMPIVIAPADLDTCSCPCFADPVCDSSPNVLDVIAAINCGFRLSQCPFPHTVCPFTDCGVYCVDVDCNGLVNVIDVIYIVNVVFRSADPAIQYCDPCD